MIKNLTEDQIEKIIELREIYLMSWPEVSESTGIESQTCAKRYRAARGERTNSHFKGKVMSRLKADKLGGEKADPEYEGANWVPALRLITGASQRLEILEFKNRVHEGDE